MADIILYHNTTCTKSMAALELLQEWDIAHKVRLYMDEPLNVEELKKLAKKLDAKPSLLVRKNTITYKEQYEGKDLSEEEWLTVLAANPILMERPIAELGNKAVIARPAEKIFDLMD